MKIKFGAIVTDGRGKIGGHVASKNRGGAYLRTKVTPSNPNTVAQAQARSLLATLAQGWRSLSDEQRLGWNAAVADWAKTDIFGDIKKPSGLNLYVKINANLSNVGLAILNDVPAKLDTPTAYVTSAQYDLTLNSATIGFSDASATGVACLVRATKTLSNGVSFVKSEFRVIGYGTVVDTVLDLSAFYQNKFGIPAVGANIVLEVQFVLPSGQKTTPSSIKMNVAAL